MFQLGIQNIACWCVVKSNLKYRLAFPWSGASALTCVIIFLKHAFLLVAKYIIRYFSSMWIETGWTFIHFLSNANRCLNRMMKVYLNCRCGFLPHNLYNWLICTSCVYLISISALIFSFKAIWISEHYECTSFDTIKRLATDAFSSHE